MTAPPPLAEHVDESPDNASLVAKRGTKMSEHLKLLREGAQNPGYVAARDLLTRAVEVVVLVARERAQEEQQSVEELEDESEDESWDRAADEGEGAADGRDEDDLWDDDDAEQEGEEAEGGEGSEEQMCCD